MVNGSILLLPSSVSIPVDFKLLRRGETQPVDSSLGVSTRRSPVSLHRSLELAKNSAHDLTLHDPASQQIIYPTALVTTGKMTKWVSE